MPQEFRAFVAHTRDASVYKEVQEHDGIERAPVRTLKGAEFTLQSYGPCPWPPEKLMGEQVVVFGRGEIVHFLQRITKALSDHEDDHNFCESNDKALEEGRELLARLSK